MTDRGILYPLTVQIAELEYQLDSSILTQRVLRLRIGISDVRACMDRVARKLQPDVSVPGFRKGRGPLALIRKQYHDRVAAESFDELKRAALDQVLKQLKDEDKPFIPPEVIGREKVRLRYDQPLEFALKYLVDPAGVGAKPEEDQADSPNAPGQPEGLNQNRSMGVPSGPKLPTPPGMPSGTGSPFKQG